MSAASRKARRAPHAPGCRKAGRPLECGGAFVCGTCAKLVGNCLGAMDDDPDDCDECANEKVAARETSLEKTIAMIASLFAALLLVSACGGNFSSSPVPPSDDAGHQLEAQNHDAAAHDAAEARDRDAAPPKRDGARDHDAMWVRS
jgi:hypothetical protein